MSEEDVESRGFKNNNYSSTSNNTSDYGKGSRGERQWRPWLIPCIVVANVGIFIAAMYINNCPKHYYLERRRRHGKCVARFLGRLSFQPLTDNPLFGPSSSTLEKLGALEWTKVVHKHQGWRLITCMWLHAGLIHLLANMLSLIFIGIRLEQQFGFARIGVSTSCQDLEELYSLPYLFEIIIIIIIYLLVPLALFSAFLEQCFPSLSLTGLFIPTRLRR